MDAVMEKDALEEAREALEGETPRDALPVECAQRAKEVEAGEGGEAEAEERKPEAGQAYLSVEEMQATDGIWWRTYQEPDKPLEDYTTREIGVFGEFLAARYLAHHGYEVLAQNWRTKFGEVDIICRYEDGTIVLVEVKTRLVLSKDRDAMPELAVDAKKQRQYRKLGLVYLMQHPDVDALRFDVMAINFIDRHSARLRHLVGAFDCDF